MFSRVLIWLCTLTLIQSRLGCILVQLGALWCRLVQTGALWRRLAHLGAGWCSLAQIGTSRRGLAQVGAVGAWGYIWVIMIHSLTILRFFIRSIAPRNLNSRYNILQSMSLSASYHHLLYTVRDSVLHIWFCL